MFEELSHLGVPMRGLVAAVIGGASMLLAADLSRPIGLKNVLTAREILRSNGIRIQYEDTGGISGRAVTYATGTGQIKVRPPKSLAVRAAVENSFD